MSKSISPISKDTAHRICSGQVVLNLATALKELIENSLDAKATSIEVRLKEYGSELIEVSDNGSGVHPDNFKALALKHHTSKINDFADLVDVETFGFRGEALSSLCAVGDVTIVTRHETESNGSKLFFDYRGVLREIQPCPRQVGTTVTIVNLFALLPVRQKEFHRNLKKEFFKASQVLSAYCLISNNVKVTCTNQLKKGSKTIFLSTQNNKTIRENISCVFGSKQVGISVASNRQHTITYHLKIAKSDILQLTNLLEIVHCAPEMKILEEFGVKDEHTLMFKVHGYISSCEHGCGRSATDRQFYFINSRPCDIKKVAKITNEIYHKYNLHQFPFVVMNITIPKESVDVNVTPDKRLIFFEHEKSLLAVIKSSLMKTFESIPSTFRLNQSVSSTNLMPSNTEKKNEDTSPLEKLNKWRSFRDRYNDSPERKRLNLDPSKPTAIKQIKLDEIFTKKSSSDIAEFEDYSLESSQKSKLDQETIDDDGNGVDYLSEAEKFLGSRTMTLPEKGEQNIQQNHDDSSDPSPNENLTEKDFKDTVQSSIDDLMSVDVCEQTNVAENMNENSNEDPDNVSDVLPKNNQNQFEEMSMKSNMIIELYDFPLPSNDVIQNVRILDTSIPKLEKLALERKVSKRKSDLRNKFHSEIDPKKNEQAEEELKKEINKDMFRQMNIVGQFNLGFIIAKLDEDLFIIDQHATDEKYNFETLQRTTTITSQKLVMPQDLNLTAINETILMDNIEILLKNGFEFSIDPTANATERVKLVAIPTSQNWHFGREDIDEMLFMLHDAPNTLCRPTRIRSMFASRACRKSVMIGTALNVSDMRRLINNMGLIEQPWNCPHGRPTMRHLVNLSLLS